MLANWGKFFMASVCRKNIYPMFYFIIIICRLFAVAFYPQPPIKAVRVTYSHVSKQIASDPAKLGKEFIRTHENILESTSAHSVYKTVPKGTFQSKRKATEKDEAINPKILAGQEVKESYSVANQQLFKFFADRLQVSVYLIGNQKLRSETSLHGYNWVLTNERTVIAGMNCQKATTVMREQPISVEAWFTDDIAISNGPSVFHGLPGLILKIETSQYTITADKIQFTEPPVIKKTRRW
ncbi:GLPGLI family protein [Rhodoflexus caldus]|uniref:GLPGLI family protein n=1 Tax=Rhodoflexus caldus TaxID=2891236 RepID=UPI00202A55E2|nr:GLPGLI family protein [Rhodoflexus caldus]